jgi:hypothetical protein
MSNTSIQKTQKTQHQIDVPERIEQGPVFTPLVDIA